MIFHTYLHNRICYHTRSLFKSSYTMATHLLTIHSAWATTYFPADFWEVALTSWGKISSTIKILGRINKLLSQRRLCEIGYLTTKNKLQRNSYRIVTEWPMLTGSSINNQEAGWRKVPAIRIQEPGLIVTLWPIFFPHIMGFRIDGRS